MASKERLYSVFKFIVITILLVAAFTVADADDVYLKQQYSKSNQSFIRIVNRTNYNLYCIIQGNNYFMDFTLYANRSSRWYIEPIGEYVWSCR